MKTYIPGQNTNLLVVTVISLMLFSGCARKSNFLTSSVVPAAEGSVKVKKDKNSNYNIDLNIIRLADPQRLSPPRSTYVVWMETEEGGPQNIGQLKTSSGLFSNELKSSLEAVSSFEPKKFFITAEDKANVQYPSNQIVLNTNAK